MTTTSTGLPDGFTVSWHGTNDNTPDGCITVHGKDALGNVTTLIMRGDNPATADLLGRIVYPSRGVSLVYAGWNNFIGSNIPAFEAGLFIVRRASRPDPA